MTKVAGTTASRAPHLAAVLIASGPLMLSGGTDALGQTWEGNHSTDWFADDNWSRDIVPNSTQDVYIDTTAPNSAKVTNKTTNGTAGAQRLHVGERGEGTLTVSDGGAVSSTHGYIGHFSGSTGTVEVTGTGAAWDNSVDLFIGDYGDGTLTVSDGGAVSSEWGYVGYNSGSTGTVEVTGIGSTLEILETLYIGEGGEGTLTISEGGSVIGTNGYIGGNNGSTGSVEVTGTGATWNNSNILLVGEHGDSTLTVSDGGVVSSAYGIIGGGSDSTGTVEVTGTGTTWNNSSSLQVGLGGDGTLTIFEGATVSVSGATELGAGSTSSGVLNIGAGSGETATGAGMLDASTVEFGDGTATLVFNHTGETGAYQFDSELSSTGSGTHSIVHESGWTDLSGNNANFTGTTVVNGGTLSVSGSLGSSSGIIGSQSGSTGIVEISGIDSIWENSEDLYIGEHGEGTLTISNGGAVSNKEGHIGYNPSSTGSVEVIGAGSTWNNSSRLYVGRGGEGILTVSDGGAVSSTHGTIGYNSGSIGSVEVTGIGSTWVNSSWLNVGHGTLMVSDGGVVRNTWSFIGAHGGLNSAVEVSGAGSTWVNSSWLYVGGAGESTLRVSDGGAVRNNNSIIGNYSSTNSSVEVTGTGSTWVSSGELTVGEDGDGALTISEDATVSVSRATLLGSKSTGSGILNIGAAAGDAAVGAGVLNTATVTFGPGTGTINFNHTDTDYIFIPQIVGNGAVHQLSGTTILSTTNSGYTGGTTVSGGVLDVRNGDALANTGEVNVSGGRLLITDTETVGDTMLTGGSLEISTGATLFADAFLLTDGTVTGGTLEGSSYTLENGNIGTALTGSGALTKTGIGTVNLTGTNTYTGGTTVSEGVLVVNGTIGDVTVNGGSLGGSGTINGSATVTSGTIAAGNSPGTLTIDGDLNLTSASILDFELGSPSGTAGVDSDLIAVGGDLTLDGSLNVTDAGGFDAGVYNLITYGGSLTDNGLAVGTAPTGFLYNVQTATAGRVNLLVNPDQLSFWNGAVTSADGTVHGGSGTWSVAGTNWTDATGSAGAPYQPDSTLIFQGTTGTVTVDSAGVSVSKGMQFAADGYTVTGGDITMNAPDTISFRVGDGTSSGADFTSTIASNLTGTGSLDKTGLGTLVLMGDNTYTGGTTVSGGKLVVNGSIGDVTVDGGSLGGSGTIGGSVSVASGTIATGNSPGTLTIGDDLNLTSASVLDFELSSPSGTAGADSDLIAVGGDLTLDGSLNVIDAGGFDAGVYNLITYGGSLTDNGLAVGTAPTGFLYNVQTATAGQVNLLVNPDQLSFWNGAVTSADGTVHGGSGTWSVAGTNWTDATGSASAPYQSDSTLIFQGTTGTVTVDSAGVSVSKGMQFAADDYTVTGGDVALTGPVQFRVGDGTAAGAGYTATIASNLTGTSSLEKIGFGKLVLTGTNTYTGGTTVSGGELVVNGTIGDVTVNGGSLGGSGTVGAVAFHSGAVIAPGNSIGTLNATSLVFNSGSTFEVELNDGGNAAGINNDLLAASGPVTINGGTVHVKPENGTDDGSTYAANTVYSILSAVGGVSGTFDSPAPTDDFAFLDFALSYDANNVYLGSQMASSTFCISGMSANQCATGEGAFSLGSGDLFNSVLNLSNADVPGALDQLSGEAHASIKTALIEDSRFAREAALSRVRIAMDSVAADGQEQVEQRVGESLAFWGQSFGSWGRWSGNSNAAGLDRSIGGFLLGGDVQIGENSHLGFFGGYDNSSFEVNGRTSSATADTLHLGAYGGTEFGPLGVRAGGSYAWHDIDTTRSVAFTGFAENLSGSYTVRIAQIFGEAGYRFDYAATSLEPFANISYIQLSGDGYSETGGSAALKAGRQTMDSTFTSIGLRAETRANLGQFNAKLSAQAAWQHAFGDVTPVVNHAFAGGDDFSVAGIPIARDALLLNLEASVELGRNTTLGLAYDGRFGSGFTDQGLKANIALKF